MDKLRQLEKKHGIQPLERIDHSKIQYKPYTKNFYAEHPSIEQMQSEEVNFVRKDKQIFIKGELVAKPIVRFDQLIDKVVDSRIVTRLG